MASVNLQFVEVLNSGPFPFRTPFQFQITFECVSPVTSDLEWKVVYIGSATNKGFDQELDSVLVGPVQQGVSRFVLEVPHPDPQKIPSEDLLDNHAVLLSGFYKDKEFVRVGYWVHNDYVKPLAEGESPPSNPSPDDMTRTVAAQPIVTRWPIPWD